MGAPADYSIRRFKRATSKRARQQPAPRSAVENQKEGRHALQSVQLRISMDNKIVSVPSLPVNQNPRSSAIPLSQFLSSRTKSAVPQETKPHDTHRSTPSRAIRRVLRENQTNR